jgi:hypothetical protein
MRPFGRVRMTAPVDASTSVKRWCGLAWARAAGACGRACGRADGPACAIPTPTGYAAAAYGIAAMANTAASRGSARPIAS